MSLSILLRSYLPADSVREFMRKRLLIVFHSKTGRTAQLADAVLAGAQHVDLTDAVEVRCLRAAAAGADDLLWAQALLIGTPENFGYMSGALKDFFDRTFYEVEGRITPLPYGMFICAGNDGTGAVRAIQRIANGYPLVEVQEAVIVRGEPGANDLARCTELGAALAFGLDAGVY